MPNGNCQRSPGHYDRFNFIVSTHRVEATRLRLVLHDAGGGVHVVHDGVWHVPHMGFRAEVTPSVDIVRVEAHVRLDDNTEFHLDCPQPPLPGPFFVSSVVAGVEDSGPNLVPFATLYLNGCSGVVPLPGSPELGLA